MTKTKTPKTKNIKLTNEEQTLLRKTCRSLAAEVPYIDRKPYSHNLVSLYLRQISEIAGKSYANQLIEQHKLETLGWKKEPEEE